MKDVQSPWSRFVLALALSTLLGCVALQGRQAPTNTIDSVLSVNASSLDFGTIVVGNSGYLSETVTNRGTLNVTILQATVTNPEFAIVSPRFPLTIPAGGSARIAIRLTPQSAGSPSGVIAIAGAHHSTTVTLRGTAILPGKFAAVPPSVRFGSVAKGKTQSRSEIFTNTGSTNITVSQANVNNNAFQLSGPSLPLVLWPSKSAVFTVTFTPSAAGEVSGSLSVSSSASLVVSNRSATTSRIRRHGRSDSNTTIPLEGMGVGQGQLAASPASLSFGTSQVGNSITKPMTLTNSGTSPLRLSQATVAGAGFRMNGMNLPVSLQAGQSMLVNVIFSPPAAGNQSGSLTIVSDGSSPVTLISLSGNAPVAASGTLNSNLTSLSFGSLQVGNTKTQSGILTNSGNASVTISQASVSGNSFSGSGLVLPLKLSAGQSTAFVVTYAPTAVGNNSGTLTIVSDASNPNLAVSLFGAATKTPAPGVLVSSLSALNFGSIEVGKTQTQSEILRNTGATGITVSQANVSGSGFSVAGLPLPLKLVAGQSANFTVTYSPTAAGVNNGSLALLSDASNPSLAASLSGTAYAAPDPGVMSETATSLNFGSVQTGNTRSQSETLKNTGGSTVTISQANLAGGGFGLDGLYLPLQLDAGESFTFSIVFAPSAAVNASGSLTLVSDASNRVPTISLSGSGVAAGRLSVSPASLSFGNVTVGASKSLTTTLSALNSSVIISSGDVSDPEFSLSGASFPLTLSSGQSVTLTLTFTPQSSGSASSSLSLATNASGATVSQTLAGLGVAVAQHSVDLSWNPSSSTSGYLVYRGAKTGGPYAKLTASAIASTFFTDSSVKSGATYFYVTTSVDSAGLESDDSNEVKASIPTP